MPRTRSVSRAWRVTVNMGNYESVTFEAGETVDLLPGEDPGTVREALTERLLREVEDEVEMLRMLSSDRRAREQPSVTDAHRAKASGQREAPRSRRR